MIQKKITDISLDIGNWPLDPDRPTIFFIHGSGSNRLFWKNQLNALNDCANTVAVDLPGHGDSPGKGMDNVNDYTQTVESLIDVMNPPMPIPCGLSLGGAVCLQMLLNQKGRYHAGIIINSGARLKVMPAIFDLIRDDYDAYIESLPQFAASPKTDPMVVQAALNEAKTCNPEVAFNDFLACNAFDVMDRLEEITSAVLILTAADDMLTHPKYGQFLNDHIPDSTHVNITAAGHFSPLEQPDNVNAAIREFLKRLT